LLGKLFQNIDGLSDSFHLKISDSICCTSTSLAEASVERQPKQILNLINSPKTYLIAC